MNYQHVLTHAKVKKQRDDLEQQRDKAIALLKDIATAQIRGATQAQIRAMLVDAIASMEAQP